MNLNRQYITLHRCQEGLNQIARKYYLNRAEQALAQLRAVTQRDREKRSEILRRKAANILQSNRDHLFAPGVASTS